MRSYELVKVLICSLLFHVNGQTAFCQSSTVCRDSNMVLRYYSSQPFERSESIPMQDGGSVAWGGQNDGYSSFVQIKILRTGAQGQVVWSTQLEPPPGIVFPDIHTTESVNGNLFVYGTAKSGQGSRPQYIFVASLAASGTMAWHHFYEIPSVQGTPVYPAAVESGAADAAGNLYLTIPFGGPAAGSVTGTVVCKINPAGGLTWNKAFILQPGTVGHTRFKGPFIENDTLTLIGGGGLWTIAQLRVTDGSLLSLKNFKSIISSGSVSAEFAYKINGSRYVVAGRHIGASGDLSGIDFSTVVFDRQLNPEKAFQVKTFSVYYANGWGGVTKNVIPTPDGQLMYGIARSHGEQSLYYGLVDTNYQVTVQKRLQYAPVTNGNFWATPLRFYRDGKVHIQSNGCSSTTGLCGLDYLSVDKDIIRVNDCFQAHDTTFMDLVPFSLVPVTFNWDATESNVLQEKSMPLNQVSASFWMEEICKEMNLCETPVITGPENICIGGSGESIFSIHKNARCFKQVSWLADTSAVTSLRKVDDTTIAVRFRKEWKGYLIATIDSHCGLIDSLLVTTHNELPGMVLGKDTSLCAGDSIHVLHPANFLGYTWNTGATATGIEVRQNGLYSVKAMRDDGCLVTDTLEVLQTFAPPAPNLPDKPFLCIGQDDVLEAGAGHEYTWQDNSRAGRFAVKAPGKYWVTVKDVNGCTGSDTVIVNGVYYPPDGFLPADTLVCGRRQSWLNPRGTYSSYLWNNGATSAALPVSGPGAYWLKVIDEYGCMGMDTVAVTTKVCRDRIYFPNAFSPDGNRSNDVFKPIIDGAPAFYQLVIYNRWGQAIFSTKNPSVGWNGQFKGKWQRGTTVVWTCNYQFGNEPRSFLKGVLTVL